MFHPHWLGPPCLTFHTLRYESTSNDMECELMHAEMTRAHDHTRGIDRARGSCVSVEMVHVCNVTCAAGARLGACHSNALCSPAWMCVRCCCLLTGFRFGCWRCPSAAALQAILPASSSVLLRLIRPATVCLPIAP